jgi:glutaminase
LRSAAAIEPLHGRAARALLDASELLVRLDRSLHAGSQHSVGPARRATRLGLAGWSHAMNKPASFLRPPVTVPLATPVLRFLTECHAAFLSDKSGAVADYIPELSKADPEQFGISIATIDGHVYETGDSDVPFTIQSISKAYVFALALEMLGHERVEAVIGVEPSGEAFNSIRLRSDHRPFNPMVNAGAIACSGLIFGTAGQQAFECIHRALCRFAGRELGVDDAVFESERATGDRNRAIGYLLRNHGVIAGDVNGVLDVYFRQCAIQVTARDLAVMGATLANYGINPVTGERVVSPYAVARTLSVMTSAGMYDFAVARVAETRVILVGGGPALTRRACFSTTMRRKSLTL